MKARLVPALALIALAGCAKLHLDKNYTLEVLSTQHLEVSPPTSEQKLKITMTSDEPVNVAVVLVKDIPPGVEDYDPALTATGPLAIEKNTKAASLTVTIPAKEKYRVYLSGAKKKATVNVKVDEQ